MRCSFVEWKYRPTRDILSGTPRAVGDLFQALSITYTLSMPTPSTMNKPAMLLVCHG
jgi:hypothetical protein